MADFVTLLYTSTCGIPTLLYTQSLKKVPVSFLDRASLYRPLERIPAPPPPRCGLSEAEPQEVSKLRYDEHPCSFMRVSPGKRGALNGDYFLFSR